MLQKRQFFLKFVRSNSFIHFFAKQKRRNSYNIFIFF